MFRKWVFEFEGHGRPFDKGDLKYVILGLLKEKPRHGYDVIRALEERFHGFYTPSAGSIYPTLQLLEDMGYVTSSEADGKKVYTITDAGRKFLEEREETVSRIKDHVKDWWGPGGWHDPRYREEFKDTMEEVKRLSRLMGRRMHRLEADQISRVHEVVKRACREIEEIVGK